MGLGGKKNSLEDFCRALKKRKNFLLVSHVHPEGDAVACLYAIESLLRRLGKKTLIACEDPFPERLSVLDKTRWRQAKDVKTKPVFDAVLVADCPGLDRIGSVTGLITPAMQVFNIDHHYTNVLFGDYNYVKAGASSCGEVIYEMFKHLKMALGPEEAKAIYVAIATDTGSFKYSNTTVRAHRIAAELIQGGLDVEAVNEEIYATYSLHKMKLYSRLLGKVQSAHGGDVVWVGMTRGDLAESGASYEDTEGFIDFLRYVKKVKIAFFMSENQKPGKIRVSLRSKGVYDVSKVAARFGGGGHRKASGCTMTGPLSEAVDRLLCEIVKNLDGKK